MEQVALAAIDAGAMRLAASCVAAVKSQFPDSRRAGRLAAAFLEAVGEGEGAETEVGGGLSAAPDNALLLKRHIAGLKTAGQHGEALAALRDYCDTFQADGDAWGALREGFSEAGRPGPAAFCAEEGVLHAPTDAAAHAVAGDAHYTAGNLSAAARHYEAAVALSGGESTRGLYGVCAAAAAAAGASGSRKKEAAEGEGGAPPDPVPALAAELLLRRYREEAAPGLSPFVEACLDGMRKSG